jgi:hypothetical protein
MFCVKEFADGTDVGRYFGSVVTAIEVSVIAVTIAAAKRAGSSVGLRTFATENLRKEDLTRKTGSEPIDDGWHQFALWIKVPLTHLPLAISSRR